MSTFPRQAVHGFAALCAGWLAASASAQSPVPPIVVTETNLKEETAVGPYHQPEWTTARRFPTTRVYLQQPPAGIGLEQWMRTRMTDGVARHRMQEELEFGLPYRMQLDFYYTWYLDGEGKATYDSVAGELRYAFADWGVIPLNPTVYLEYKQVDPDAGANVIESKLLLGEELSRSWHWGMNLIYERELDGEKAEELAVSQAFSYTLVDRKLSLGVEMKYAEETAVDHRNDPERTFLLGPSLQWRPTDNTHLDLVPLFGLTGEGPDMESYVVFGVDFGPGNSRARAPVSLQSN